ncbi:MAG: hypothetical protein HQ539_03805 [Parcubacteria group bacterium]|nr:hypothetical protein [Parcubacteria group bacterium]
MDRCCLWNTSQERSFIMERTLWIQGVLEEEYSEDQRKVTGKDISDSEAVICKVPESLHPLLWKETALLKEKKEIVDHLYIEKIDGLSINEHLAYKVKLIKYLEECMVVVATNFWFELRLLNPSLNITHDMTVRSNYQIVKMDKSEYSECKEIGGIYILT